eukprot:1157969-Pelagomonas_calceolata.AAC.21
MVDTKIMNFQLCGSSDFWVWWHGKWPFDQAWHEPGYHAQHTTGQLHVPWCSKLLRDPNHGDPSRK